MVSVASSGPWEALLPLLFTAIHIAILLNPQYWLGGAAMIVVPTLPIMLVDALRMALVLLPYRVHRVSLFTYLNVSNGEGERFWDHVRPSNE